MSRAKDRLVEDGNVNQRYLMAKGFQRKLRIKKYKKGGKSSMKKGAC